MSLSAFNIRRLISQKKAKYGAADVDSDEAAQSKLASKACRKESWLMRRPQSRKRHRPPTPIIISRPQGLHSVLCPLPPLPFEKPRSSASSSSCSCEQHGSCASPRFAGMRRSPLCSISSKDDQSEFSLQPSNATSYAASELSPILPVKEGFKPLPSVEDKEGSSSKLDLMEALNLEPEDKELTTNPPVSGKGNRAGLLPDNIHQLIQETDEAFKAVGSALAEANFARLSFNETPKLPPLDNTDDGILYSPTLRPTSKSSRQKSQQRLVTLAVASPSRNPSVSRVKRNNSKKSSPMRSQRKPPVAMRHANKHNSRWTLSEKLDVHELFSGKLFSRIEADEMLSPTQIEAYKLRRESKLQLETKNSNETFQTTDTESTDTPIEPFHMDDLRSRIGSSGGKLNAKTPVDDKQPGVAFFNGPVERDFSLERRGDELFLGEIPGRSVSPVQEYARLYKRPPVPYQPPMRDPLRYMSPKKLPRLPSIPEVTPVQNDDLFLGAGSNPDSVADADYIFLRSSPFTITAAGFRHGPIRLAKTDFRPDPKLGADDGLDWTAFQMAILGGAGDLYSDSEDEIQQQEAEDLEVLLDWWDDLHFEGLGELVTREAEAHSPTSTVTGEDYSDVSYSEIEQDNPYSARHKWQRLRRSAAAKGQKVDLNLPLHKPSKFNVEGYDPHKLYNGGGVQRWTAESQETHRESLVSMPQSPMLDLTIVRSENGDIDYVPMGYNLSHDLGDFLQWEGANVYADHNLYAGGVI